MKKRMLSLILAITVCVSLMMAMTLTAGAAAEHSHDGWTGITALSEITSAGNYYLEDNITSTSYWTVNYDVNLCLNGHELKFSKRYIKVENGATLSICDCSEDEVGRIYSTNDSYTIYNKGTVNLYSGMIDYTASSSMIATIDNRSGATFNMYGGKLDSTYHSILNKGTVNISGGTVTSKRDAIQADAGNVTISGTALVTGTGSGWATVNLYGGTFDITGGTVTHGNGGLPVNVPASASGSINISGGSITTSGMKDTVYLTSANVDVTITGGSITNTFGSVSYSSSDGRRYGWAIDVINVKSLTISGAPVIDSIYLAKNKTITVGENGLSNTTLIPVYCRTEPAAVTGQNTADYSANFTPKENYAGTYVIYNDNNVVMFGRPVTISGTVAITGTAEVGQTLEAVYTPADSEENVTLTYQWYRDGVAIDGATGAEYTVVSADSATTLKVVVTGIVPYKGSLYANVTVIVPVTVTGVSVADKEYDGTPVTRAGTPKAMNGSIEVTGLSYTYTWYKNSVSEANKLSGAPKTAGDYVLVVAVDGGAFVGQQVIEFTIERKPITEPAQAAAVTYNGASQTYGVIATDDYTVTGGVQTAANEAGYDVTISLTDKANTCWANGTTADLTHKFIINKKSVIITAEDKSAYVGNKQPELTYTVSGLIGVDELTTEPTLTTNADMKLVGEYTITASGADAGSNYTITHMPGKLTVEQIPVTLYSITKAPCENGKVTVQAVMAAKGSTIKVSAVPAEGYKVVSLTVTDAAGNEIEVVDGRVTMPASDITVSAVFVYDLPYIDVADDNEHYTAIAYMYVNGLMVGTSTEEYIFDGDVTMTRAQIAQILYCLAGKPAAGYAGTFTDVAEGAWYASAVEWAAAEGIVYGVGNDKFAPDRTITTAEMAALIYRYAQCKQNGECTTSDWLTESAEALSWCVDNGILTDTSAAANRYLAAEMFYNMHNLLNK